MVMRKLLEITCIELLLTILSVVNWPIIEIENLPDPVSRSVVRIGNVSASVSNVLAKVIGCEFSAYWQNVPGAGAADPEKDGDHRFLSVPGRIWVVCDPGLVAG
jgi:hypothetical protein